MDKVNTSDSFFVKLRKKNEGEIYMVVEKEKNKTNTDPVTITIDQKDTYDVQKIYNINVRKKIKAKNVFFTKLMCGFIDANRQK